MIISSSNLNALSYLWICVGGAVALVLQFFTAWYSRFFSGWSFFHLILPGSIGWLIMESFSPLTLIASYYSHGGSLQSLPIPMILWIIHYVYRSFIYPFTRFLKPMPFEVTLSAIFFNLMNGSLNGASFAVNEIQSNFLLLFGSIVWLLGFIGNVHSDEVVRSLRKSPADKDTYKIPPPKGMHKYLSSPNYSCETFEWFGLWIATGFQPAPLSFAIWSICNLAPHAKSNRDWYIKKFGDSYPKERKIFIPFIW